jgi:hypothetical protein
MIRIRITQEMMTDLFTPGVLDLHRCVDGLPPTVKGLIDVDMEISGTVIMIFDDGDDENIVDIPLTLSNTPLNKTTSNHSGNNFDDAMSIV